MASQIPPGELDLQEQLVRIRRAIVESDKFSVETRKLLAESKSVSAATIFQGALALAAVLGAGAAIAKLFFP